MEIKEICDNLTLPSVVGPVEVYETIGHWNTAVLVILALHLLPVWGAAFTFLYKLSSHQLPSVIITCSCLISIPPALMSLATVGILAPSLGVYVEILHEVVISFGLFQFVSLCVKLFDDEKYIISCCNKSDVRLPIGSPPFVCLLPFPQPEINSKNFKLMVLAPKLLFFYKILIFGVEIIYTIVGYQPSGDFVALDNLHNIIGIPVGLITIYFYTMFNFVMNKVMVDNTKRFVGVILLLEFILFDCMRLFFIFLTGTGMLQCVPPFLSQKLVEHLMKNYIKAFLATGIGMAMMKIVAEPENNATGSSRTGSTPASMSSLILSVASEEETK